MAITRQKFAEKLETFNPSEDWAGIPKTWFRLCLGLGDAVAFSGALVWSLERYGPTIYPCQVEYFDSVKSFYVNHPQIRVVTLEECMKELAELEPDDEIPFGVRTVIAIEHTRPLHSKREMYEDIYRALNVPYSARWDHCPIKEASKSVVQRIIPEVPYAFLHFKKDNPLDRARIGEGLEIAAPTHFEGESVLAYADAIERATEVHVINSVFWWLTEHLEPRGKLHAHWYARDFLPIWQEYRHRKNWTFYL